jgi:hypothetical protein
MKRLFAIILIFLALLISRIQFTHELPLNSAHADTSVVNPNGASELAVLMREMQEYSSSERIRVRNGLTPSEMPQSFENIGTALITNGMHKSENYDTFADIYLVNVKAYIDSPKGSERISAYNNMVASCLACHSEQCPGPVPVIRKLMITSED